MDEKKLISVIVPCYNEQEVLPMFYKEIVKVSAGMQEQHPELEFEYLFIDDGSKDRTLRTLRILTKYDKRVRYISFSRNFGKEAGMYAGLQNAKGDYCVVMDADLQHPPAFLPKMYEAVASGEYDCATTRRVSREGESKVRSWFAHRFYGIMNHISQTEIVDGAQDFRFMTRQMVDAVLSMTEYNRFSKGIFSWVGFRVKYLEYENVERAAGTTAWSFWGLVRYSLEGIMGFSTAPLSIAAVAGLISCLLGLVMLIVTIIKKLAVGEPVAGYPTLICTILFFGGLQLFCTGILGLYLGKTYLEVKHRPIYLTRETEADAEKYTADEEPEALAEAEDDADADEEAAETAEKLERAKRLKQEADEAFDAAIEAVDEAEEELEDETEEDFADENENADEEADYSGDDFADEEEAEPEEAAAAENDAAEEAVSEAEEILTREAPAEEAPKPKKPKFEVKIDYDSINFDEDFDDEPEKAAADADREEYDEDAEYDEDTEYDEDEEYDEDAEYEDDEYADDADGDDEKLTLGGRFALLWEKIKEKCGEIKAKILEDDSEPEDGEEEAEDGAADYDDYDEDEAYDAEDDEEYDDYGDAEDDEEYDDYDDAEYEDEDAEPEDDDDDEDDSGYRGAHF